MYWGPWNWSLSSKRDFKLMIWSRVVIGWRTLSRALLKTLRTEYSEEFLTWRHINDPWIFMCAFIKSNMVPNNAGKWRNFFWVDFFAIFGLTIGPYSFLPIYISLCDSHRNCSSSDLSRLSYPNLTLFHLICKVVQDELNKVFKLMLTAWHYKPIKSILVENQPIRGWAKSIVFETRLRHTCRFTRTSFTSNNKNLTVIIVQCFQNLFSISQNRQNSLVCLECILEWFSDLWLYLCMRQITQKHQNEKLPNFS